MLEPVNWNWGAIRPDPAYLRRMRDLTAEAGIVLFFDEIQSAFKTRHLTAQAEYGVTPDVTTIGKSLGGGLPVSAFSGSAPIMDLFQPVGPVQALRHLQRPPGTDSWPPWRSCGRPASRTSTTRWRRWRTTSIAA